MEVGVSDVITHAKFSDNRFRGLGDTGGGQIYQSFIDFYWLSLSSLKQSGTIVSVPACDSKTPLQFRLLTKIGLERPYVRLW